MGYVVNPETKEFTEKSKGSFCNNTRLIIMEKIETCKLALSSSELSKLNSYDTLKKNQIVKLGSIAYKVALVAKGKIDIAISFTKKNDWDLAAAHLIIEEAGGKILQITGE